MLAQAILRLIDGVAFKTRDDSDGRFYTPENLADVKFVPDEGCDAAVKIDYDLKKRYVSFEPDTTANLTWRAFRDSTGIKRQEVKGSVLLKDRWGGVSSIPIHRLFNDLSYEPQEDTDPEVGDLILYANPVPGETYQTEEIRSVLVNASELDALFSPLTVNFKIVITLLVK